MFPFQGFTAVARGKINLKVVLTGFRNHTIAYVHVQGQQLMIFAKRGGELHVTESAGRFAR
jgi:hypothetical protein